MPKSFLVHSLFLLSAVVLTYFWTASPALSLYNLQFICLFVVFYFLSHFLSKPSATTSAIDAIIFTIIILLLVSSTGGLASPLFFLIYFLLFAISFLFEPAITLTLTAAIILFFWQSPITPATLVQLLSVVLILPLALFVGKQYLHLLSTQEKIKILEKEGQKLESHLANEESHSLLWLSLNFKDGLLNILHLSSDLLAGLGDLTLIQKESLEKIHETAKDLLKSGQNLKEKIDKETD